VRNRKEILKDLVLLQGHIEVLEKELSQYSWDVEMPLLSVTEIDFINIIQKCINNEIDFETLSKWADAIECRDDLDFVNEKMVDIIFELANSEINGKITEKRLKEIVKNLSE